ncbi:ANKRD17 [Symbiodinium sp. CCMP2592]|nr:ANKRD17 [Symbiodinium sp. CCMP2592]
MNSDAFRGGSTRQFSQRRLTLPAVLLCVCVCFLRPRVDAGGFVSIRRFVHAWSVHAEADESRGTISAPPPTADKSSEYRRLGSLDYIFPMYTVPLEILLQMKRIRTHEEMLADNELTQFEEHMGRAMFISHQWLGSKHPDPCGQQMKVLQEALSNILSGTSQVSLPIVTEIIHGRWACPTSTEFKSQELFIWYDYFCCPQDASGPAAHSRQRAIYSIPSYIAKCELFVILCPALRHDDSSALSQASLWTGSALQSSTALRTVCFICHPREFGS